MTALLEIIDKKMLESILPDAKELLKMLIFSTKTIKEKQ